MLFLYVLCIFIYIAKKCKLISNSIALPSELTYMIHDVERIHSITSTESDIIKRIRASNKNKAYGHDNVLVKMSKLCPNSVIQLFWYFKTFWLLVHFLTNGKEQILAQSIRIMVKKSYQSYWPVSLLPICRKIKAI